MNDLVIVGIPTWCEAAVIRAQAERVDMAASRAFPGGEVELVLSDNCSPDGTEAEFVAARTRLPKMVLRGVPGERGKGYNVQRIFRYAHERSARAVVLLDADLEEVPDDWLPALSGPVLAGEADVVTPLYPRHWYDGNQTNQVVAPLVLAVTGHPIRQPIGGEFAFSPAAVSRALEEPWSAGALGFGVDVYLVVQALRSGLRVRQAPLSLGKLHSWRSDTADQVEQEMDGKFEGITGTTLTELARWTGAVPFPLPDFPLPPPPGRAPLHYDTAHILETARRGCAMHGAGEMFAELLGDRDLATGLDDQAWGGVLKRALERARRGPLTRDVYDALRALFFVRLSTVLPALDDAAVEPMVARVAHTLAVQLHGTGRG